ncbi:MAG: hypothetical protein FLDDKLPJ_02519 [Phycisphaerae bacterium]|nr:hypothetical protein [Phycisphaerae bacterium]
MSVHPGFMKPSRVAAAACVIAGMLAARDADAGIKLITLPPRERVEIQLDHPNVTLVEEERVVPLNAGVNEVVFAWANTQIDKESIQFRPLSDPENVRVLSVSYPPNENALTWQVASPKAGSARVRISYLIGQLDKSFAYEATAANDEKSLTLRQYVLLHNRANETFGDAGMWPGFGERFERPIGINETKQLLSAKFENVPVRKVYTADLSEFGYLDEGKKQLRVPMHYLLKNDSANALGKFPFMYGKARVYQDDGRGTTAFLGEDWLKFTPRDDEVRLYLGVAKDVVVKRTIARRDQNRVLGNLYHYDVVVKYEIENFKDAPVVLDIAESMQSLRREILGRDTGRNVEFELVKDTPMAEMLDKEKSTADRLLFHVPLPARGGDQKAVKATQELHVLIKNEW